MVASGMLKTLPQNKGMSVNNIHYPQGSTCSSMYQTVVCSHTSQIILYLFNDMLNTLLLLVISASLYFYLSAFCLLHLFIVHKNKPFNCYMVLWCIFLHTINLAVLSFEYFIVILMLDVYF